MNAHKCALVTENYIDDTSAIFCYCVSFFGKKSTSNLLLSHTNKSQKRLLEALGTKCQVFTNFFSVIEFKISLARFNHLSRRK